MTRILFIFLLIINVKSLIKAESICEDSNEVQDFHEGKNFYEFLVNYVTGRTVNDVVFLRMLPLQAT